MGSKTPRGYASFQLVTYIPWCLDASARRVGGALHKRQETSARKRTVPWMQGVRLAVVGALREAAPFPMKSANPSILNYRGRDKPSAPNENEITPSPLCDSLRGH